MPCPKPEAQFHDGVSLYFICHHEMFTLSKGPGFWQAMFKLSIPWASVDYLSQHIFFNQNTFVSHPFHYIKYTLYLAESSRNVSLGLKQLSH